MAEPSTASSAARNYRAWCVSPVHFPGGGTLDDKVRYLARFAILAPSVHNSQPWRIEISGSDIRIGARADWRLPVSDPSGSFQRMSLGMCAENVVTAARYFGVAADLDIERDGTVVIALRDGGTRDDALSPALIVSRVSDKRPYLEASVPTETLRAIAAASRDGDARCVFITDPVGKRAVVDAHQRAIDETASDAAFVRELARFLKPNTTRCVRGMPGFVADVPTLPSLVAPPLLQIFPALMRPLVSKEAERVVARSAGFGTITSDDHTPAGDVGVGRAYQRTALRLRQAGVVDAMITASIGLAPIRSALQGTLGLAHEMRLLFRFGYAPPGLRRHTPREPLE